MNTNEELERIFKEYKRIAVVGLSSNSIRPSNGVASFMIEKGYEVLPVNPNETEIFGTRCYRSLMEIDGEIDLVDVFRRSEFAGEAIDQAIAVNAKGVWLQEGVIDNEGAKRAQEAGLDVVMDKCWLKEWYRYGK